MKAVSIMFTLVIDQTCTTIELEMEVAYEDGTVRLHKQPAHRPIRLDLEALYMEGEDARKAG